jgi:hypothetical protein
MTTAGAITKSQTPAAMRKSTRRQRAWRDMEIWPMFLLVREKARRATVSARFPACCSSADRSRARCCLFFTNATRLSSLSIGPARSTLLAPLVPKPNFSCESKRTNPYLEVDSVETLLGVRNDGHFRGQVTISHDRYGRRLAGSVGLMASRDGSAGRNAEVLPRQGHKRRGVWSMHARTVLIRLKTSREIILVPEIIQFIKCCPDHCGLKS